MTFCNFLRTCNLVEDFWLMVEVAGNSETSARHKIPEDIFIVFQLFYSLLTLAERPKWRLLVRPRHRWNDNNEHRVKVIRFEDLD